MHLQLRSLFFLCCTLLPFQVAAKHHRKERHRMTGKRGSVKREETEKPTVVFDSTRTDNVSRVYERIHNFHKLSHKRDGKPRVPEQLKNISRIYDRVRLRKRLPLTSQEGEKRQMVYLDNHHHSHHNHDYIHHDLAMGGSLQSELLTNEAGSLENIHGGQEMFPLHIGNGPHDNDGSFPLHMAGAADHAHHLGATIAQGLEDGAQSFNDLPHEQQGGATGILLPLQDSVPLESQIVPSIRPVVLGASDLDHDTSDAVHLHQQAIHMERPHSVYSHLHSNHQGRVHREVCHNGGLFVPISQREFQCICPEKYLGKTCNERNFCRPCPCKNSGKCYIIDRSPRYKCDCSIGYLGYNCERRNPCYPSRCNNGGSCTHDGLTATCVCPPKFTGQFCDELRNCVPNPCLNNGMCIEKSGAGKFECDCAPEYKGSVCGKIRYCNSNPCKNSGECHEEDDGFKCTCVTPWQGDTCEQRICSPNPCKNAGTCVEIAEGSKFKCICQKWTTGTLCEEVRPCLLKPCLNGGRCIDAFSGYNWMYGPLQYYCLCSPPYHGMNCEVNQCKNCHEHAHCQVDHCVCDDGYIGNGLLCTVKPDPCHPNPCRNDGECVADDDGSYQCNCKKPFLPPKCEREDPCADNPCLHGECKIQGDSYECICKGDWVGKLCDDKDPCRNNPCANGGICKGVGKPKKAQCICKGKWVPPLCKECRCPKRGLPGIPDPECDKQSGECVCPSGFRFEGDQCIPEEDKTLKGNPCERAPCLNGGTCIPSTDSNSYTCKCSPSYYGKDCEYKRVCASNPCKNGGTCKEENGKFVACVCPQGFAQPFCSKEPTSHGYCQTYVNPCKNGGQCVSNGNAYDCVCPIRYTGPNCGVDKCANCDDNARCLNGKCRCNAGFIGSGYECIKDSPGQQQMLVVETTCQPCPQHASCVDNSCQCNPGYSYVDSFCLPANPLGQKKAALSNPTSENVKSKKHRIP